MKNTRLLQWAAMGCAALIAVAAQAADKKPNILMLMQDDTGWQDFGCYLGGRALGHPTPHVDQLAKEGAMFTSWYGQASCIVKHPSIKRFPGGASNDLIPDLQHPENPLPLVDPTKPINVKGAGD